MKVGHWVKDYVLWKTGPPGQSGVARSLAYLPAAAARECSGAQVCVTAGRGGSPEKILTELLSPSCLEIVTLGCWKLESQD